MKTLTEIKNSKSLRELYAESMENLFRQVTGKIFYCKQRNFAPVLIVSIALTEDRSDRIKVEFLHEEKTHIIQYESWSEVASNFLSSEEFEDRREAYEALIKYQKSFSRRTPRKPLVMGPRPPMNPIRYK